MSNDPTNDPGQKEGLATLKADFRRERLRRFTVDELDHLANLPADHPEQQLTAAEIEAARALVAQIDAGVTFIGAA